MADLSRYFNRHDASKHYERLMFLSGRNLQAPELNEIQELAIHRMRSVTDALFKDGDIIRDAGLNVNADTGETVCQSGAVYVAGAVRGVAAAELTIAVNTTVVVGLYVQKSVVTELEDPSIKDPSVGSRNIGNPGAFREKIECVWGFAGDGQTGEFFPIYTVENGIVRAKEPPPNLDAVTQALARYDRDSSGGSYVVSGLQVAKQADIGGDQVYTVAEGRAHVNGFGIELPTSRRVIYAAEPDLLFIENEPHVSTTLAAQRIELNRTPVSAITQVTVTSRKTATLSHGGFTGAPDPLPNTSIVAILAVNQGGVVNGAGDGFTGGTTYVQGSDYKLTADKVDWSLAGSEVAPGSSYQVIYTCIENVVPTSVDETGFTITGAVVGTSIQVDYNQKLPRIDKLCLDAEGAFTWVKGVAASYNPQPPAVPPSLLPLASVYQSWDANRRVSNDGVRMVPMHEIASINSRIDRIADLLAQARLTSDAQGRDVAAKKGMFVDPFFNDNLRDQGIAQDAAVVKGVLTLPIAGTVSQVGSDIAAPSSLAYTLEPVLEQVMRTTTMKVNPYLAFDPIPAAVKITPAVDRWTEVQTTWNSPLTSRFVIGSGDESSISTNTFTETVSENTSRIETLRTIEVTFNISGFGPNEQLQSVKFDGIVVTPTAI